MEFMYLELSYVEREDSERIFDNGVHVTVKNDGSCHSLGSGNARVDSNPFAVYKIAHFDGLECIDYDDLVAELRSRNRYISLEQDALRAVSTEDLLAELSDRVNRPCH